MLYVEQNKGQGKVENCNKKSGVWKWTGALVNHKTLRYEDANGIEIIDQGVGAMSGGVSFSGMYVCILKCT